MELHRREFEEIRHLVHTTMGIWLADEKQTMVQNRLHKFVASKGFPSYARYIDHVREDKTGQELVELASRISTNFTFFFRENEHFTFLKNQALPQIARRQKAGRGERDLRIWCAACATGEEAYSLMITVMEFLGKEYPLWNGGLLATDISARALTTAKTGVYEKEKLKLVPGTLRVKYFHPVGDQQFEVVPALKREITFRHFNLTNRTFPFKKPFQAIFCRNMMMYLDNQGRNELLRRFHHWLVPGGYLFIGHSESIRGFDLPFEYVQPSVFRKVGPE